MDIVKPPFFFVKLRKESLPIQCKCVDICKLEKNPPDLVHLIPGENKFIHKKK